VRATLRRPKDMRKILYYSYGIVTLIFVTNGITFLIAYGNKGLLTMAFDYFQNTKILGILEWLFYLTLPCTILICLISNSVEIENLGIS